MLQVLTRKLVILQNLCHETGTDDITRARRSYVVQETSSGSFV